MKKGKTHLLLLCSLIVLVTAGCSVLKSEYKVGTDIRSEDITDFYFTFDRSTNPPYYQRYRFYTEDGKYWFYHEKRSGDHWPLTEADITIHGTVELNEEQWDTFFNYLKDGTVKSRTEDITDGGSGGPWTFLYWKNDGGKIQEYTFSSWSQSVFFEEFCEGLAAGR